MEQIFQEKWKKQVLNEYDVKERRIEGDENVDTRKVVVFNENAT
jgi:hypothetical protein